MDVRLLLEIVAVVAALWVVSWLVLIVLARRLGPGPPRGIAGVPPARRTAAPRRRKDEALPRRAKLALLVAILWVLSPIDLLPEFLPVIGPLDDVVAVVLLLRYAGRSIPRGTLLEAWPPELALLPRLPGERTAARGPERP